MKYVCYYCQLDFNEEEGEQTNVITYTHEVFVCDDCNRLRDLGVIKGAIQMTDQKCKDIVDDKLKGRIEDLRLVWKGYQAGYEYRDFEPLHTHGRECPVCDTEDIKLLDHETRICEKCFDKLQDLGSFPEYALSFDYVTPDTFNQKEGYFRYQISCGGPSDEFRFFVNLDFTVHRIEYWHLDWFDGASVTLSDDDLELLTEIYDHFDDCETTKHEFKKVMEEV